MSIGDVWTSAQTGSTTEMYSKKKFLSLHFNDFSKGLESDPPKSSQAQEHFTTFLNFSLIQKYFLV